MARIDTLIRAAAAGGSRLIVLPELANTGYVFANIEEARALAEPVPAGPSATAWCALAAALDVYIVAGICECDGEKLYNAALIAGPDGYIGTYRKMHLWNRENIVFDRGNLGIPVFDMPLGRIGIAICYDGWFPETFRQLALEGAEIICIPTNWVPMPGQQPGQEAMPHILHKAAAHSNGLFIACADRTGIERGQVFEGQSLILGPRGRCIAGPASRDEEQIVTAALHLDEIAQARRLNEFNIILQDRRADIYG